MDNFIFSPVGSEQANKTALETSDRGIFSFSMNFEDWKKFEAVVTMAEVYFDNSAKLQIDKEAIGWMSKVSDEALLSFEMNVKRWHVVRHERSCPHSPG